MLDKSPKVWYNGPVADIRGDRDFGIIDNFNNFFTNLFVHFDT
jgi:hypothetical protein